MASTVLNIVSGSPGYTRKLGKRIGELAEAGDVVLLVGELGAGKTCLTQGIARGLGIDEKVVSPTFVLLREYRGRLPLYHIDFYRLDTMEEIASLGLEDYIYGDGVCVVEWAEKGLEIFPDEHLRIDIKYLAPAKRELSLLSVGPGYERLLTGLQDSRKVIRR